MRLRYHLTCPSCGQGQDGETDMSTSLEPGASTPIFGSCPCGAEASGQAVVVGMAPTDVR